MAIESIRLKNVTAFEEINMEFSSGINILIGENGTGKTHLMKILYAVSQERKYFIDAYKEGFKLIVDEAEQNEQEVIEYLKDKKVKIRAVGSKGIAILDYFSSTNTDYSNLIRNMQKAANVSQLEDTKEKELIENKIEVELDGEIYELYFKSKKLSNFTFGEFAGEKSNMDFVFIPAKEVLSHSKGFISTYEEREIAFDKTWYDIIVKAQKGFLKKLDSDMQASLDKISELIGGSVEVKGDQFYIKKQNGLDIEFNFEAEGLRKIGLLWILIRNGSIKKDSVLFWDEPESNINPKIIPFIIDVLLFLQRAGVQIFVATHNYNFAKYFEMRRKDADRIMFYSLVGGNNRPVSYTKSQSFKELENNSILEADEDMLSEVLSDKWGDTIV